MTEKLTPAAEAFREELANILVPSLPTRIGDFRIDIDIAEAIEAGCRLFDAREREHAAEVRHADIRLAHAMNALRKIERDSEDELSRECAREALLATAEKPETCRVMTLNPDNDYVCYCHYECDTQPCGAELPCPDHPEPAK